MSLSIIPLVILGQITEASINDDVSLYQMTFKDTNGVPLYGVKAVWTDEQAEIEALAAQKSYGVWINPIDGTFTVKFAGYAYTGTADLDNPGVLAGITPIEFNNEAAGGGGSGDFEYCTVTISTNMSGDAIAVSIPFVVDDEGSKGLYPKVLISSSATRSFKVPLYKGYALCICDIGSNIQVLTSGNVTLEGENAIGIRGDGTITLSSK